MTIGRLAGLLLALGLAALCFVNPSAAPLPQCPVRLCLDLYCPGCGSLRAIHSLLNGEIVQAWRYNALLVCLVPLIAGCVIHEYFPRRSLSPTRIHFGLIGTLLVAVLLFGVIRNIPLFAYLQPHKIENCQPACDKDLDPVVVSKSVYP